MAKAKTFIDYLLLSDRRDFDVKNKVKFSDSLRFIRLFFIVISFMFTRNMVFFYQFLQYNSKLNHVYNMKIL